MPRPTYPKILATMTRGTLPKMAQVARSTSTALSGFLLSDWRGLVYGDRTIPGAMLLHSHMPESRPCKIQLDLIACVRIAADNVSHGTKDGE